MSGNQTNDVGLPAGSRVGKYEIIQRLAIGGQGIVYKARDPMLDRFVAIKQMSAHLAADATFLERFQREAQILAKLGSDQSAVVTVLDMIQDERGLFMVMEFVAGHTLEDSLHDNPGPIETKAVLAILWRLAAGLHAVHQSGIIHRDLKPGNIIIGTGLRCKIMDFGVAATSDAQTSMVLGTTKYMAPELYEHKSVDARADMYSLGFITYEMLVGRAKFNELFADIVRDKHSEHLRWMKWHGSESQTATPLHEVMPDLPRAISDIVARMMSKRPADRYANMEELGKEIKLAFTPKPAAAGKSKSKSGKSHKRLKAAKAATAAAPASSARETSPAFADEPTLDDPPLTAPLPKKTVSLRTKMLIAGAVSACLVTGLVVLLLQGKQGGAETEKQVKAAYAGAESQYKAQQYALAAEMFAGVARRHSRIEEVSQASVRMHLATAQSAIVRAENAKNLDEQAQHWQTAADTMDLADAAAQAVQAAHPRQEWVTKLQTEVKDLQSSRRVRQQFQDAVNKANERLEAKKYDEAQQALLGAPPTGLREREDLKASLHRRIASAKFEDAYSASLGLAKKAREDGDFSRATAELSRTAKLVAEERSGAVSADRLAEMKAEVEQMQKALKSTGAYTQAVARANQLLKDAENLQGKDPVSARLRKEDALEQLEAAMKLQPDAALRQHVVTLQAEVAYETGMEYLAAGERAKAVGAFERSLEIHETPAAKQALGALLNEIKLTQLMTEADREFDGQKYPAALKLYQAARGVAADRDKVKEIDAQIAECEFNVLLGSADAWMRQRKYDEAKAALEEAALKLPDRAEEAVDRLARMVQMQKYEKHFEAGKELLAKKDFTRARAELLSAQKIDDTPEVQDLIAEVQYGQFLKQGNDMMGQTRYSEAKAFFKWAQDIKNTDEIQLLIKQADEKMK